MSYAFADAQASTGLALHNDLFERIAEGERAERDALQDHI